MKNSALHYHSLQALLLFIAIFALSSTCFADRVGGPRGAGGLHQGKGGAINKGGKQINRGNRPNKGYHPNRPANKYNNGYYNHDGHYYNYYDNGINDYYDDESIEPEVTQSQNENNVEDSNCQVTEQCNAENTCIRTKDCE